MRATPIPVGATGRFFSCLLGFLLPVHAVEFEAKPLERASKTVDGITFHFPKGEEDVVDLIAEDVVAWREELKQTLDKPIRAMRASTATPQTVSAFSMALGKYAGLDERDPLLQDELARNLDSTARSYADTLSSLTGSFKEVHFWDRRELEPWRVEVNSETCRFPCFVYHFNPNQMEFSEELLAFENILFSNPDIGNKNDEAGFRVDWVLPDTWGATPRETAEAFRTDLLKPVINRLPAHARQSAAQRIVLAVEDAGVASLMKLWAFEGLENEVIEAAVRGHLGFAISQSIDQEINLYAYMRSRLGRDLLTQKELKLPAFWDALWPKVDGFSVKQARSEERQLIAGTWAMTLSKTRRTEHLARIHEKLMSVPDGERSVDHWRQVCRELEDPEGASFETLLEQTFKEIRDVSLGETAKPIEDPPADEKAVSPLAEDDPRRPSDPLPKEVAENRLSAEFGGRKISYPIELKKVVASLADELSKRSSDEHNRSGQSEASRPEPDERFEKAIRQWCLETTGLNPPGPVDREFFQQARRITPELAAPTFLDWNFDIWFKEDLKDLLRSGVHVQYFTYDDATDTATLSLGLSVNSDGIKEGFEESTMPLIIPHPAANATDADLRAVVEEALANLQILQDLNPHAQASDFLIAHEFFESIVVFKVVRSQDRRWFCDGMANYLALLFCRHHLGTENADAMFASLWDEEAARAVADQVDLRSWPTAEAIKSGAQPEPPEQDAHYYFATRVIERACRDQGDDFIKRWLAEIRKIYDRRRNMQTVTEAYAKLTGKDLLLIMDLVMSGLD